MNAHPPAFQHSPLQKLIESLAGRMLRGEAGPQIAHQARGTAFAAAAAVRVRERIAEILDALGEAYFALDAEGRITDLNRAAEAAFGAARADLLGRPLEEHGSKPHAGHGPAAWAETLLRRFLDIRASGAPAVVTAQAPDGSGRSVDYHVFPDENGVGICISDGTERRRVEKVLTESRAQLSALADNLPLGMVYQMDDAVGFEERRFLYMSASCERLNGVPAEEALADPGLLYGLILPEHREATARMQGEAHRERRPFDIEFPIRHARTGEIRWQRIVDAPRRLADGRYVWDGIQIDITDHKRAQERLQLLVNELNHRVKNTLATVQSLVMQCFGRAGTDGAFAAARESFEERLFALARAHDMLTRENWQGARLHGLVTQALAPYRPPAGGTDNVRIDGPDLVVPPAMALSLSMALHELSTNAVKYGALKSGGGGIRIAWNASGPPEARRLALRWEEHGGPPVTPPSRKGFGSRLIEGGLARELNGTARLDFAPAGLACMLDIPLPRPEAGGPA